MSNYSNFVGYVPDKLRLETTGGALVEGELGLPNEYIASLSIGPVSTGAYVSNPGIALDAAATFTIESGSSYIQFKNLTATKNAIVVTGASEGSGTDFEADFSNLEYVGYQITGRSDRLKKFSLGALKRIDSLDNNGRIALYYSGGHDVTGEVYSPNLVQAAGYSGVFLNYGSGGLKNLDNTFTGYVSGMIIISGYADYGSGNHELLPYEDFLPVHQVGGLKFWAGSNWENVVLGMNHTGVSLGNGNTSASSPLQGLTWNIYTHQNTTGVVFPRVVNEGVNAYVSTPTTNTGDLTITCSGAPLTKPSGFYNRLDFNQNTDGRNLTVINNSNEYFYIPYIGNIGAINIKSSGSLNFSGLCLTGVSQQYVNSTSRYSKFQATDDIVVNLTTGTFLAGRSNNGANGGCVFWAISESGNVTFEALNLKQTNVGWLAQLKGSGTTGLINLPEATGLIPTGTNPHGTSEQGGALMQLYPGGADAVDTVQTINIPKLQQYSGTLTAYGLSGSTTRISGADLTSWSGNHNFYTSGDLYYTFTGGGGDGSGEVIGTLDNRTYLSGNIISGNRGTLKRCNAITYSLSGVDGTGILVADELREISGNINLRGLSGTTINVTGADVDYISGYLIANTSGKINYTFTGGPGAGSGVMSSYIQNYVYKSGNTITGKLGTLSQNGGITVSGANADAVDTSVSLTATSLHQIGGNVNLYGLSGSTITCSGADPTYLSGRIYAYTSGAIDYTFTGGPGDGSGYMTSHIYQYAYGANATVTGNVGTLASGNQIRQDCYSGSNYLAATGMHMWTGSHQFYTNGTESTLTGKFGDITYINGGITAYTSGKIDLTYTGGPGTGGGYMTSHLYIRNYTTGNTFTGNFGTLRSGAIVSGRIYSGDSNISIYATGMSQWNNSHKFFADAATSGDSNTKFTVDFGDIEHLSGVIDAYSYTTGHTFNYNHGPAKSGYMTNYWKHVDYAPAGNQVTWNMGSLKNVGNSTSRTAGYLFPYQYADLLATGKSMTFNATGLQDANGITGYVNYGSTVTLNLNTFHTRNRLYAQASAGGTYLANGTGDLPATTGGSIDYIQHYSLLTAGSGQLTTVSGTYGGYVTGVGSFCHAYDNAGSGYTYIGLPNLTGYSHNATYLNAYSNRTTNLGSGHAEIYAPQWTWSGSTYWQAYVQSNSNNMGGTAKITIGDAVKVGQYIGIYSQGNNSLAQITLTGNTAYEIGRNNNSDYLNVNTRYCDADKPAKVTGLLGNLQTISGYYQLYNYPEALSGRIVVQTTGLKRITHYAALYADGSGCFVSGNLGKLESIGYASQSSNLAVYARGVDATGYFIATGDPGYEATGEVKHGIFNDVANGAYVETRVNNFRSCNYVYNYATGTSILEATGLQSITGNYYFIQLGYYNAAYPTLVSGNFPNLHENSGYFQYDLIGQATGYLNYNTARTSGFIDDYVIIRGRNSDPNISGYVNLGGTTDVRKNYFQVYTSGDWVIDATGITNVTGYTQLISYGKSVGSGITSVTGNFSNTRSGFTVAALGTSGHIQFTSNYTGIFEPQIWATGGYNTTLVELNLDSMDAIGASGVRLRNSGTTLISMTGMRCISGGYTLYQVGDTSTRGYGTHGFETVTALTGVATAITGYNNLTGTVVISGNTFTGEVNATALKQIGYESIAMSYTSGAIIATGIKTAKFPALTGWYGQIRMELPAITGFDMSSLVWMGASGTSGSTGSDTQRLYRPLYFEFGSNLTGDLDLGALQHLHVYSNNTDGANAVTTPAFHIIGSGLTSVSMGAVITGSTQGQSSVIRSGVIEGSNITGLTFGASGTTKKMEMHFMASGCALNQASVDATLQMFASLDGTNGTTTYSGLTITLNGLCAAPSTAGSGYRDTLTGAGRDCTVLINS